MKKESEREEEEKKKMKEDGYTEVLQRLTFYALRNALRIFFY